MKRKKFVKTKKDDMKRMVQDGLDFVRNDMELQQPFYADELARAVLGRGSIRESDRIFVVDRVIPKINERLSYDNGIFLCFDQADGRWLPKANIRTEFIRTISSIVGWLKSWKMELKKDHARRLSKEHGKKLLSLVDRIEDLQGEAEELLKNFVVDRLREIECQK